LSQWSSNEMALSTSYTV